jgi:hypothetical protein
VITTIGQFGMEERQRDKTVSASKDSAKSPVRTNRASSNARRSFLIFSFPSRFGLLE